MTGTKYLEIQALNFKYFNDNIAGIKTFSFEGLNFVLFYNQTQGKNILAPAETFLVSHAVLPVIVSGLVGINPNWFVGENVMVYLRHHCLLGYRRGTTVLVVKCSVAGRARPVINLF